MRKQNYRRAFFYFMVFAVMVSAVTLKAFAQPVRTSESGNTAHTLDTSEYDAAVAKNPEDFMAYYQRGRVYIDRNEFEQALADFERATSLNPKFTAPYSGRGYIYIQKKMFTEAVREFNRVKELDPNDSYASDTLKSVYAIIGNGNLPLEQYDELIQLEPKNATFYYGRAKRRYSLEKDYISAIEDASKALEFNPKYAEAYAVRADSFCKTGKRKESNADVTKYDELIGKKSKWGCRYCARLDYDCQIGDLTEDINLYIKEKVRLNLINSLYTQRGILYYAKGDLDSALSDFNKTEDKNGFVSAASYRAAIYKRKGKYDEALSDYNSILSKNPNSSVTSARVGEIYLIKKEYETAFGYFEQALTTNRRNSKAYQGRGIVYLERGKDYSGDGNEVKAAESYRNAVKDFDSVIEIDLTKADREVYLNRAEAYEKLGETEKAAADRAKAEELVEKP